VGRSNKSFSRGSRSRRIRPTSAPLPWISSSASSIPSTRGRNERSRRSNRGTTSVPMERTSGHSRSSGNRRFSRPNRWSEHRYHLELNSDRDDAMGESDYAAPTIALALKSRPALELQARPLKGGGKGSPSVGSPPLKTGTGSQRASKPGLSRRWPSALRPNRAFLPSTRAPARVKEK
jgi:hypothetical protein